MGKYTDWAKQKATSITTIGSTLTDEQALSNVGFFVPWRTETAYGVDQIISYGSTLYRCLTAHTSQTTWTPDVSPSLWVRIDNPAIEWPDWVQPTGSTDAYSKGAKVTHNEKHWISTVDANVWEPGVYGWEEQI